MIVGVNQNQDSDATRLRSELDVLLQISALTTQVSDVDYLLTRCLEVVCAGQQWLAGQIWFVEGDKLVCSPNSHAAFIDISDHREASLSRPVIRGEGTVGLAWDTEAAIWSANSNSSSNDVAIFAFPVRKGRAVIGVCEFITGQNEPHPESTYFFERLGSYLGQVLVQKETEQSLHLAELKYRQIISKAYDGFMALDRNGVVIDWNIQCEKMFGWFKKDVLGKQLLNLIIPESQRASYHAELEAFIETGSSSVFNRRVELQVLHHDGHEFPVELAIFPVAYENKLVFGAFVQDVTAKREQAAREKIWTAELIRTRDEAIALSSLKSQFVANMSHEIRTPMAGMLGCAELIAMTETDPEVNELAQHVLLSANRLMRIVDDLLDFSKLEVGKIIINNEHISLRSLIQEVVSINKPLAQKRGLSLISQVDEMIPSDLHGDGFRIRQVLLNLVNNAIKFSSAGSVVIKVTPSQNGSIGEYEFSVEDNGIGIAVDAQRLLFEPFTQVEQANAREYGGTGLGLSICKRLVELMDGEIRFESQLGKGSVFSFTLPLRT